MFYMHAVFSLQYHFMKCSFDIYTQFAQPRCDLSSFRKHCVSSSSLLQYSKHVINSTITHISKDKFKIVRFHTGKETLPSNWRFGQSWPKGSGTLLVPPPFFARKLVRNRQFTVVNTAMPRFPPPPLNKVEVHTL